MSRVFESGFASLGAARRRGHLADPFGTGVFGPQGLKARGLLACGGQINRITWPFSGQLEGAK